MHILFIDDSPLTRKDANNLLNKLEEMNNRQLAMNNRQIKIEKELSDVRRLLASSRVSVVETGYTTENEFIDVRICICYEATFIETFFTYSNTLK